MTPAELAERNVGLVYAIAGDQWRKLGGEYDDLVGDGMVGLMQAAMRFDPDKGTRVFSVYAKARVTGAIIDGYRNRHRRTAVGDRAEVLTFTGVMPDTRQFPSAECQAVDRGALSELLEKVAALPASLREVTEVVMAGGSFVPIAVRDGVTPSAVSVRWKVARSLLSLGGERFPQRAGWCRAGHEVTGANAMSQGAGRPTTCRMCRYQARDQRRWAA